LKLQINGDNRKNRNTTKISYALVWFRYFQTQNYISRFFDKFSFSSGIELELRPSRIKGFYIFCLNHTPECQNHTHACKNHSYQCQNLTHACGNHTRVCQSHTHACGNHTRACVLKNWAYLSKNIFKNRQKTCQFHTLQCRIFSTR
jgi:hypothetical protein